MFFSRTQIKPGVANLCQMYFHIKVVRQSSSKSIKVNPETAGSVWTPSEPHYRHQLLVHPDTQHQTPPRPPIHPIGGPSLHASNLQFQATFQLRRRRQHFFLRSLDNLTVFELQKYLPILLERSTTIQLPRQVQDQPPSRNLPSFEQSFDSCPLPPQDTTQWITTQANRRHGAPNALPTLIIAISGILPRSHPFCERERRRCTRRRTRNVEDCDWGMDFR